MPSLFPPILRDRHWSGVWWLFIVCVAALLPVFGFSFANWFRGLLSSAVDGTIELGFPPSDLIDGVGSGLRYAPCFVILAAFVLDSHSLSQRVGMAATYLMCHAALMLLFVVGISEGSISNPLYFSYDAYVFAFLAPAAALLSAALAGLLRESFRWVINPIAVTSRSRALRRFSFSSMPIWICMAALGTTYIGYFSPTHDNAGGEHWIDGLILSCLPSIGLAVTTLCTIALVLGENSILRKIGFVFGIALAHLSVAFVAAAAFRQMGWSEFPPLDLEKSVMPLSSVAAGTCVVVFLCVCFRKVEMRLATSRSVLPNGRMRDQGIRSQLTSA